MKAVSLSAYRVLITPVRQIFSSYKSFFLSFVFIAGLLPQQLLAQDIANSAIFDSADSSYLSRTPATAGNRKTWTWSGWVKRSKLGAVNYRIISSATGSGDESFRFDATGDGDRLRIYFNGANSGDVKTTPVFRDPSTWYHLVVAVDTTQITPSNRVKIYVDGSEVTDLATSSYPEQNYDTSINNNGLTAIGASQAPSEYFDGYLSDTYFIDGQALDSTSFGKFDSLGNWQPKTYSGSYGTNGFHLDFSDSAYFGKDISGNGNDFADNGFTTDHQVADTPTNNFPVLNAAHRGLGSYDATISHGGLKLTRSGGAYSGAPVTIPIPKTGKWGFKIKLTGAVSGGNDGTFGIAHDANGQSSPSGYPVANNWHTFVGISYMYGGNVHKKFNGGSDVLHYDGPLSVTNDEFEFLVDRDAGTVDIKKNGVAFGTQITGLPADNDLFPYATIYGSEVLFTFDYSPTEPGYKTLSTKNLPKPIIANPKEHFDIGLWTGNGGSQTAVNDWNFQADFLWTKLRNAVDHHILRDAVRDGGTTMAKSLRSSSSIAEYSSNGTLTVDSTGFSVNGHDGGEFNYSGYDYVTWGWKAGGTPVTNTDGSITSTVSANIAAGFSIVSYTGTGASATVGHGLDVSPALLIVKNLDSVASNWAASFTSLGVGVWLNLTNVDGYNAGWPGYVTTSSTFSMSNWTDTNASGDEYIAYCFAEVEGFSKFGSYTGNGSADGPFIYTGFKPAYVMMKRLDLPGSWLIRDSARGANPNITKLHADTNEAEMNVDLVALDYLSNGFKLRGVGGWMNQSGSSYAYIAFAEKPFGIFADETPPQLSEIYAVPALTSNTQPAYSFNTNEAGTLQMGGSCSTATTTSVEGDNTITLNLAEGTYSDCTITVTDEAGNASEPLAISEFTIDPNYQYEIDTALEFNSGNGEYLSWTPTQAGNTTTWTWSAWVQRGNLGDINTLLYVGDGSQAAYVRFNSSNELEIALGDGSTHTYQSDSFSNTQEWSHLALSVDTTQATATDRIKLYLNGQLQTPNEGYIDPQQDAETLVNSTNTHYVGNGAGSNYYDGAMADVRLVDGMALGASAFGKQTAQGAWIPVEYTAGGGSNSSHLNFENGSNLGIDSTNGNDWTVIGLDDDSQTAATPTNTPPAGFIPGELSVGQGGNATYTIPIGVPKGVAGMQPELSINYNSSGGNGLLGVGFSLGGMSAITRCPATFAQDGFKGGVYFSDEDRFCLDGQRLIAISGVRGAGGTEYRTEIDGFSKIISYGEQGSGPSYWKVWTKSGQTIEFGNTEDSRVEVVGNQSVLLWSINKISDVVDNQINYSYNKDAVNGEHNVNEITYSNVAVKFQYQDRNDTYTGFALGGKVKSSKRLLGVESSVNGQLVKKYTLDYRYSEVTGRSQLLNINECDSEGNCFSPLQFDYEASVEGLAASAVSTSINLAPHTLLGLNKHLQDVDNDGRTDIVFLSGTFVDVYEGKLDGSFNNTAVSSQLNTCSSNNTYKTKSILADFNADGIQDVAYALVGVNAKVCVHLGIGGAHFNSNSTETSFRLSDTYLNSYSKGGLEFNDFNGDGYADISLLNNSEENGFWPLRMFLGEGDGTFTDVTPESRCGFSPQEMISDMTTQCRFHDVNGDGLPDAVSTSYINGNVKVRLSKGNVNNLETSTTTTRPSGSWSYTTYDRRFADVNGDGSLDYVLTKKANLIAYVFLGHGDGSFDATPIMSDIEGTWREEDFTHDIVDIDGDGVADLLVTEIENGNIFIFPGKGDGAFVLSSKQLATDRSYGYEDFENRFSDVNNDGKIDYVHINTSNGRVFSSLSQYSFDRVSEITDGLGITTNIEYKPLTDTTVYTKGSGSTYPEIDLAGAMQVVSKVTTPDGLGGTHSTEYKYGGLKVNVLGRGSLGFAWMQSTDNQTGMVTKTEYSQTYPYVGQVTRTEQKLSDGTLLGETTATFNHTTSHGDKVYFPYTEQTIDKKYDLDGTLLATTTTDNVFDAFANPTRITVTTVDSEDTVVKDTLSDYINNTLSDHINDIHVWHLGRLTRASVTHTNAQGSITRTSAFSYNTDGLLETEIIEPDNLDLRLQTDYQYDSFGNKIQVTTSGQGIESRSSSTTYTADGRFPESVTNSLGHSETRTYNPILGVMTSLTGPNGLTTSWDYDSFGRKVREDRADGTWSSITRGQCGVTDCPQDAPEGTGLYTVTESSGATPVSVFSDKLGRETRKVKTGFDGTLVYEDTEYNSLGQISRKSQPYFKGDTTHWASSEYDILGRVKKVSQQGPDGVVENTFSYSGFSTTATNAKGHVKTSRKNAQGKVVRVDEEEGGWVSYKYDAIGNLLETNANGILTTLSYDLRGRKSAMDDPGMGQWSYDYDVLGKLISQTDAKDQTTTMVYDKLGRMVQRTEAEGISTWTYDTANKGIGKLAQVSGPDGYLQQVTYDDLGRASTTTTIADGKTLNTTTEYDSFSRVSRTIRPEGFILDNLYNAHGYLEAVHSPTAQIGDYDAAHLEAVKDEALAVADLLLQQVEDYNVKSTTFRQRAADYETYSKHIPQNSEIVALLRSAANSLEAGGELNSVVGTLNSAHAKLDPIVAAYNALLALPETADDLNKGAEELEQLAAETLALAENYLHWAENPTLNVTLVENAGLYQLDIDDAENIYFWRAKSRDAAGRLTSSIVGNGLETQKIYHQATGQLTNIISGFGYAAPIRDLSYQYDDLNNVASRVDQVLGMSESFEYDRQDRLTRSQVQGQIGEVNYDYAVDYAYDAMGNMLHKSDVGDYTYGDQNRSTGNAGPHALLSAGANHTGYQYDLNGNMLQGGGRDISWNSFNKPTEFRKDGTLHASFKYGPDRSRYLKVTPSTRTLYLGKAYERIETGDKVEHKHFVYADGNLVAIHVKSTENDVAQPDNTRYLHRDSLGSIDTITDGQGNIVDRMSYEPFGARRGGDWRAFTGEPVIPVLTNRGFTGHEHVDEMNLIHMNGRVYDPQLGRFLSADPTMQFPYKSQGYNRYTYVGNNPLKYTDPSGYGWFSKIFKAIKKLFKSVVKFIKNNIRTLVSLAIMAIPGGQGIGAAMLKGFAAGVVGSGGNLKAGILGALTAGAFHLAGTHFPGRFENAVAHGVIGGVRSVAMGGKFGSGFLSGAFGSIATPSATNGFEFGGFVQAAVAGGVGSVLGGGKFKNGAITAAFGYAFNAAMHPKQERSFWDNPGRHLPSLPQGVVDFSAGLGDAIFFGFGDEMRNYLGINGGINYDSDYYSYGGYSSVIAMGGNRLAYASVVKGYSFLAKSGSAASAFRTAAGNIFRYGARRPYRPNLRNYNSDAALRAASGRSNSYVNSLGATHIGASVYNIEYQER